VSIRSPKTKLELLHPLGFKYDLWSLVCWVDWDEEELEVTDCDFNSQIKDWRLFQSS